jgi:hypothetical protein
MILRSDMWVKNLKQLGTTLKHIFEKEDKKASVRMISLLVIWTEHVKMKETF